MVLANPAGVYGIEAELIAMTKDGYRIESYDVGFVNVVPPAVPLDEPASPYNSYVRPVSEFLHLEGVAEWKAKTDEIARQYEEKRIASNQRYRNRHKRLLKILKRKGSI